jgi:hypothetical protein
VAQQARHTEVPRMPSVQLQVSGPDHTNTANTYRVEGSGSENKSQLKQMTNLPATACRGCTSEGAVAARQAAPRQSPPAAGPRSSTHAAGGAQHSTAQHSTAQHSTAQHSTAQHSTAQHSTAQHDVRGRG